VNRARETEAHAVERSSYAGSGSFALGRVHLSEWLVGFGGIALVVALFLPWSGETSGLASPSVLKLLVLAAGLGAAALPLVVAFSVQTNVPIVWEVMLANGVSLVTLLLLVRLVFPPEGGLASGFFTVLAGSVLTLLAGWRSVAREY
jgi:hypothetical protein